MIIRNIARQGRLIAPMARGLSTTTTMKSTTTTNNTTSTESQDASLPQAQAKAPTSRIVAWSSRKTNKRADTAAADYITMTKLQRKTNKLGSSIETRYAPADLIRNPPSPKDISLELLMAAQSHLGHRPSLWNANNSRYIAGIRNDLHIISLEQTAAHLKRAARVVEEVAYRGGLILFVGTRKNQRDIVVRAAQLAQGCHVYDKWVSGAITNRDQILRNSKLEIVDHNDRPVDDFEPHLASRRAVAPDLVVCLNPLENFVLLRECAGTSVPTIGIIDTDADPGRVTYAIPANDDSLRCVATIAGILGRAAEIGHKRRLRDAQQGIVAWETPADVQRFIDEQRGDGPSLRPIEQPPKYGRGAHNSALEVRTFSRD